MAVWPLLGGNLKIAESRILTFLPWVLTSPLISYRLWSAMRPDEIRLHEFRLSKTGSVRVVRACQTFRVPRHRVASGMGPCSWRRIDRQPATARRHPPGIQ